MPARIRPRPDGTIDVDGEAYRVTERGEERYDVHRERDHVLVGSFVLRAGDEEPEVVAEAAQTTLVRDVAVAWAGPKGIMPLQ
jgi:hypothetical protein